MLGLIGLDWGTSSLRAYRFDAAGRLLDSRVRPWGIRHLPPGGFEAALQQITENWPDLPRLACGMVGSRNGWHEVSYVGLPAAAAQLAAAIHVMPGGGRHGLGIVPGMRNPRGADVMRGEETQLAGALQMQPALATRSTWLLPGTHSKWVSVRGAAVVDFGTRMTGELFAVLLHYSILGADTGTGAGTEPPSVVALDAAAFERGVMAARDSRSAGAFSVLFSARTLMLDGALQPASVPSYLSGLLIGEELRSITTEQRFALDEPIQLIGDDALCHRYRAAAHHFEMRFAEPLVDAAAYGLWHLAQLAGWSGAAAQPQDKETSSC